MKRIFTILLISALVCAFTAGCTQAPKTAFSDTGDSSLTSSQRGKDSTLQSPTATGFKKLSKNMVAVLGSGTEGGFYETYPAAAGSANIVYIDYAAAKEIYLCALPNCKHNSKSCNSWIPTEEAGMFPLVAGEHLLLIKRTYGGEEGKQALPRIESVDLDGANRKVLIEFAASEYLGDVFSSNGSVLICSITTRDSNNKVTTSLVSIDLSTGERTDFYKTTASGNGEKTYYGTTSNGYCLLMEFSQSSPQEEPSDLNDKQAIMDAAAEAEKSTEQIWYSVPFGNDTEAVISNETAYKVAVEVCENGLFLFNCETKELTLVNASDGARNVLATIQQEKIDSASFNGMIDDWLILDTNYDNNENVIIAKRFAINVNDGTVKELSIMCGYAQSATVTPSILGYDNDNILLISQRFSNFGALHYGFVYSVIPKEDYLNSIDTQMKKVEFIEDQK